MRRVVAAVAITVLAVLLATSIFGEGPVDPFDVTAILVVEGREYKVYVAEGPEEWRLGYMGQEGYDPRGVGAVGMAFPFGRAGRWCMWMKDTMVPLRAVWILNGTVTEVADLRPLDERPVCGFGDTVVELSPDIEIRPGDRVALKWG